MSALRTRSVVKPTPQRARGEVSAALGPRATGPSEWAPCESAPAESLESALRYASAMGWAVLPGCDQGRAGRRCGRADCLTGPAHPVSQHARLTPTRDETAIYRWWRRGPAAPVLLATGRSFDVLDVPPWAAAEALRRIRLTGQRLGPLARTADARLLIWTTPGSRRALRLPWPYAALDLHLRGVDDYVPAPPSHGARWLDPPVPYTHRMLPRCADLLDAVATACRERGGPAVGA